MVEVASPPKHPPASRKDGAIAYGRFHLLFVPGTGRLPPPQKGRGHRTPRGLVWQTKGDSPAGERRSIALSHPPKDTP